MSQDGDRPSEREVAEMMARLGYPRPLASMIDSHPVNALVFVDDSVENAETRQDVMPQELLDELETLRRSGVREGALVVTDTPAEHLAVSGGESTWRQYYDRCARAEIHWQDEQWMVVLSA